MKSYSTLRAQFGTLTNNSATANLTLGDQLINDSLRYLTTKYFFNERTTTVPGGTVASQQEYKLPYNIKTLINVYVNVGNIRYQLREAPTRQFWDSLNFVPYTSDIPQYYYIFNKQLLMFPSPATSSNSITYVYKIRLRDLSVADYSSGTASVTTATSTITTGGATWTADMAGRWIRLTAGSSDPTGDEQWYEISSVATNTITLVNAYAGATVTGASYVIGEMPILPEDYQDLPVYRACSIYFTTRVPDASRAQLFGQMYKEGADRLDAEFGSKSWSVAITPNDTEIINPNLFTRNLS